VPEGQTYSEVGSPDDGGALSALARIAQTVRDPNASREEKALALKFIVHTVSDVHQPLHVGKGEDRSDNRATEAASSFCVKSNARRHLSAGPTPKPRTALSDLRWQIG